jgi:hypothetical protein
METTKTVAWKIKFINLQLMPVLKNKILKR